jgi:hypothetical protein
MFQGAPVFNSRLVVYCHINEQVIIHIRLVTSKRFSILQVSASVAISESFAFLIVGLREITAVK